MRNWRLLLGLLLICGGAGLFVWTALPAPQTSKALSIGGSQQVEAQTPGLWWEYREVRISYPTRMRLGEVLRLQFEAAPVGAVQGAESPFTQYAVFAESYPDLAGLSYAPEGKLSQAWIDGKPLVFTWQLRGDHIGHFEGRLWFSLKLVPRDGSPALNFPLLAVPLDFEVVSLLGLDVDTMRWISAMLILTGVGILVWGITKLKRK